MASKCNAPPARQFRGGCPPTRHPATSRKQCWAAVQFLARSRQFRRSSTHILLERPIYRLAASEPAAKPPTLPTANPVGTSDSPAAISTSIPAPHSALPITAAPNLFPVSAKSSGSALLPSAPAASGFSAGARIYTCRRSIPARAPLWRICSPVKPWLFTARTAARPKSYSDSSRQPCWSFWQVILLRRTSISAGFSRLS